MPQAPMIGIGFSRCENPVTSNLAFHSLARRSYSSRKTEKPTGIGKCSLKIESKVRQVPQMQYFTSKFFTSKDLAGSRQIEEAVTL